MYRARVASIKMLFCSSYAETNLRYSDLCRMIHCCIKYIIIVRIHKTFKIHIHPQPTNKCLHMGISNEWHDFCVNNW